MADEKKENKVMFEREYVVPLRRGWLKVQKYKRATKAVKTLKEFMVQHMKVYDRDTRKIKVDIYLNNEIRFRGMKKPLNKVKVKATKYENGEVVVRLAELPKHIEFEIARRARKEAEIIQKTAEKEKTMPKAEVKEEKKPSEDTKEKEISSKLAEEAIEKAKANEAKHTPMSKVTTKREPEIRRKALKR